SPFTPVTLPGIIVHRKSDPSQGLTNESAVSALLVQQERSTRIRAPQTSDSQLHIELLSTEQTKGEERPKAIPRPPALTPSVQPSPKPTGPATTYAEAKSLYEQGRYPEVSEKLRGEYMRQDQTAAPFTQQEAV